MTFLPFVTIAAADTRTVELWANGRGPGWRDGDVTTKLYGVVTRPEDPEEPTDLPDGVDVALRVARHTVHLDRLMLEVALTDREMAALVGYYDEWVTGGKYAVDDMRRHGTQLYRCVQGHTNYDPGHTPDVTPALWTPVVPEGVVPAWVTPTGAHDSYPLDALVTHAGYVWRSTINANVWEPGTGDLWEQLESLNGEEPGDEIQPWVQPMGAHDAYQKGDRVTYKGWIWESMIDANVWAPGVYGWVKVEQL